jgi:2-oxoglutarate ferredoxin oxidoreductase subunit alpha
MFRELPIHGGVAVQGEDEIASLGMCIGAAMAGARCMTATSGPGMSLYSENIGLAIMGEVPLVIVNVMRLGPATGGATTVGQGDVQFVRWGTSGGYPIIALCPTNPVECYSLTIRSFQLAERFRCPVFLLTDREVVATMSALDVVNNNPTVLTQQVTRARPDHEHFMSYRIHDLSDVPPFSAYGGKNLMRFTGSTHDEEGFLTKDPKKVEKLNRHLAAKIEAHFDEIETVSADLQDGARTLLVGYGITARSILEATRTIRENGKKVSSLVIHSLWPVPETAIKRALRGIDRALVAELNLGQYRLELERVTGSNDHRTEIVGINRVDGELISPQQTLDATL